MIDLIRSHDPAAEALIEAGTSERVSYGALLDRVTKISARLRAAVTRRGLVILAMGQDIESVVRYLACLDARLPVCLAEPRLELVTRLVEAYEPAMVLVTDPIPLPAGYRDTEPAAGLHRVGVRERSGSDRAHPELAALLTTSGSTASPKLVRLTAQNLRSNAIAIADYLGLGSSERAVASLPLHYSYGLSVLDSHLVAGGTIVLTSHSFMRPEFWQVVDAERCTSFAGVPYMYETLHRLRFDPSRHPSLATLTQAGGALRPDLIAAFADLATRAHIRFFVMYGQTEATARISYVPPAMLPRKIGAIGIAIPGGALALAPVADAPEAQELVYRGPNVMMGYATGPADLEHGDELGGVLHTGDLARLDADGYFHLTGRLTRFAKLFGRRVSLEDVEARLERNFAVRAAAADGGDRLVVYLERLGEFDHAVLESDLAQLLAVPPTAITVRVVDHLPRTASGKKDYRALERIP